MAREARTITIAHGSHTIRAGIGIHDVLKLPAVELRARVGLKQSQVDSLRQWSLRQASSDDIASNRINGATGVDTPDSSDDLLPPVKPVDYLVGHFLDSALQTPEAHVDDPVHVFWPMVGGEIVDWGGMQALWYYLLFFTLPVIRSTNASVTLLSLPPQALNRFSIARIHKIFFEELNCPAFCLVDSALASTFAAGQMSALVVDVGRKGSSASSIVDAMLCLGSVRTCRVGLQECICYLAALLSKDEQVMLALQSISASQPSTSTSATSYDLLLELAEELFKQGQITLGEEDSAYGQQATQAATADDDGNFDVLGALTSGREKELIAEQQKRNKMLIEQGQEPEAELQPNGLQNGSSADPAAESTAVSITFRGKEIKVPAAPLAQAAAPLMDPSVLRTVDAGFFALQKPPKTDASADAKQDQGDEPIDWTTTPSLPEIISQSITSVQDLDRRNPLWELLLITGRPTAVLRGLTSHIVSALSRFIATSSSSNGAGGAAPAGASSGFEDGGMGIGFNGQQPNNVRALKTPDYFTEFKDRTDLAPYLGAMIYAKLVFADNQARGYLTKAVYMDKGPSAAFTVAAVDK